MAPDLVKGERIGHNPRRGNEPRRHILLYVQHPGRLQLLSCALEIREKMEETDVETILQRAREKYPGENPRIITDNGPQLIAKDFKEFIRVCGMTHVRASPYYPQSNGKLERYHRTIKGEYIRPGTPLSLEDARRLVARYVQHYNTVRLHSAIGYLFTEEELRSVKIPSMLFLGEREKR